MLPGRAVLPLLLTLPLLLAGCSLRGGDDDADAGATTTTTTPTSGGGAATTTTTTTPTPPTSPTPTSGAARNPVPPRVMQHDHQQPPASDSFDVPADALPTNLSIHFAPSAFAGPAPSAFCGGDARVRIVDPAGATYREAAAKASQGCAPPLVARNVTLAPGRWTVRFEGTGNATSIVTVGGEGDAGAGSGGASAFRVNLTHDYATPGETLNFTIPEGAAPGLALRAYVRAAQTAPGVAACFGVMRILVTAPTGDAWLDGVASQGQGADECALVTTVTPNAGTPLPAGEWTVEFQGQGAGVGVVEVGPPA